MILGHDCFFLHRWHAEPVSYVWLALQNTLGSFAYSGSWGCANNSKQNILDILYLRFTFSTFGTGFRDSIKSPIVTRLPSVVRHAYIHIFLFVSLLVGEIPTTTCRRNGGWIKKLPTVFCSGFLGSHLLFSTCRFICFIGMSFQKHSLLSVFYLGIEVCT